MQQINSRRGTAKASWLEDEATASWGKWFGRPQEKSSGRFKYPMKKSESGSELHRLAVRLSSGAVIRGQGGFYIPAGGEETWRVRGDGVHRRYRDGVFKNSVEEGFQPRSPVR